MHLIYMYEHDALNNLQMLIWSKAQPTNKETKMEDKMNFCVKSQDNKSEIDNKVI